MSDANANLAREVVQRVKDRARDMAKEIAANVGEPVDASKLTRDEARRLWNLPNPQANPMQIQQLVMQGKHSEALDMAYPWRNKLIGSGSPTERVKRAQHLAEQAQSEEIV